MSFQTLSIAPDLSTDAAFRAWGSAISNAIVLAGLVKTGDTGQINWATVTRPTVLNTYAGYEIFRFTDSLQATHPVFIKVEYGAGAVAANPSIRVRTGAATDGAGNLLSHASYPNSLLPATMAAFGGFSSSGTYGTPTVPGSFHVASDNSTLLLAGWYDHGSSSAAGGIILIERTRNFDGTPNTDGVFVIVASAYGGSNSPGAPSYSMMLLGMAPFFTVTGTSNYLPAGTYPNNGVAMANTAVVGGNFYSYPVFTGLSPRLGGPSKFVIAHWANDMGVNATQPVTHYGESCTFKSIGPRQNGWHAGPTGGWPMTGAYRIA